MTLRLRYFETLRVGEKRREAETQPLAFESISSVSSPVSRLADLRKELRFLARR